MGSRQSFATPHSRVPSAMIGQYTLKPDTHSNRDTGVTGSIQLTTRVGDAVYDIVLDVFRV